ncbi:MAG: NUDIX hydrolase [Terriglobia bacterium]
MQREYPDRPILGVGAVVRNNDSVLLVLRSHEPHRREWTLPGGVVETGETLEMAVRREIREETGLRVTAVRLLTVFERIIRRNGQVRFHYVVLDYFCRLEGGKLKAASDVAGARWVRPEDFPRYKVSTAARRVIRKALTGTSGL